MDEPKRTLKQKAYHGLKEYLVISCYLWLVFSLFVIYRAVLLSEGISIVAHGEALINALALGKVMLVAQELDFDVLRLANELLDENVGNAEGGARLAARLVERRVKLCG